ncbi:MAG TPA: heme-binding protein [Sphingomonas sp.]|nr:heme-binding protein [Sphingomonas sp.]
MKRAIASITTLAFLLASCGGGGGADTSQSPAAPSPPPATTVYTTPARIALTSADVRQIIAQTAAEATARSHPATIAVVDRVGNVLALYRMTGAKSLMHVADAPNGQNFDAQGLTVPSEFGAISKAVTGAYLSSDQNAFSSRTASMITQQHFPPAPVAEGLESGPLYGVQFSSLPCSDFNTRFGSGAPQIGPKRTPLGLSADPGGFPLYKNGTLVGGIGVMSDGEYGFDPDVLDVDANNDDEIIALAGTYAFEAPGEILASRITIDGTSLRYSDATGTDLKSNPATPPAFTAVSGTLLAQSSFAAAIVNDGAVLGTEASGIRASTPSEFSNRDAWVFSDGAGTNRFPIRAGTDGLMTATEARTILEEAFKIMSRARGQIRRPLDSRAQVTISLVDSAGAVLGMVRAPDAPMFGADVSLQKARTAAFFSSSTAGDVLDNDPSPDVRNFAVRARAFLGSAAFSGQFAFSDRANGNLHRPFFPDGQVNRPEGPFSRPIEQFNPLSTGLQSALILSGLRAQLLSNSRPFCTTTARTGNGIQIFPGSVPIYRGETLVGAIGISGDGIDQDDMISFLGTSNAGLKLNTGIGNAPVGRRADQLVFALPNSPGVRLRYVSCPFAPFLDTSEQNVCEGR